MANDPPSALRMGFGFLEARAAGAPYVGPRPVWKINWDIRNKQAERKLRDLVKQHPSAGALVREVMEARKVQGLDVCKAAELYHVVLYNRPNLAPVGYWDYARKTFGWLSPPQSN